MAYQRLLWSESLTAGSFIYGLLLVSSMCVAHWLPIYVMPGCRRLREAWVRWALTRRVRLRPLVLPSTCACASANYTRSSSCWRGRGELRASCTLHQSWSDVSAPPVWTIAHQGAGAQVSQGVVFITWSIHYLLYLYSRGMRYLLLHKHVANHCAFKQSKWQTPDLKIKPLQITLLLCHDAMRTHVIHCQ